MRQHPHLYEISAWPWLERLSQQQAREVTLGTVDGHAWDAIAREGMDGVYLMGVWTRSEAGRLMARTDVSLLAEYERVLPGWGMSDVPGSPYCIRSYEPDPRMGGWQGLDRARRELADRGIQLVLDFVANHTGFDHDWIRAHPEYYVQGTLDAYRSEPSLFHPIEDGNGGVRFIACGRDPFFPPWRDVAQLNYFNPALREAMIGVLRTIAQHGDGVRCDMAMLVLNDIFAGTWQPRVDLLWRAPASEFWPEATRRAPMMYLAEVYWDREFELQQQGFDFTYDKRLLDRLIRGDARETRRHLEADPVYAAKLARFVENHDEPRSLAQLGGRFRAAAALAFTLPGMRFFFDGQFAGATERAPVQLGRWPAQSDDPAVREFYARLLHTIAEPIFHEGTWSLLDVRDTGDDTHGDLLACAWRKGEELAVVAANITPRAAEGLVQIPALPPGSSFEVVDRLSGESWNWTRADLQNGLYVRLGSGGAHLFTITESTRTTD